MYSVEGTSLAQNPLTLQLLVKFHFFQVYMFSSSSLHHIFVLLSIFVVFSASVSFYTHTCQLFLSYLISEM